MVSSGDAVVLEVLEIGDEASPFEPVEVRAARDQVMLQGELKVRGVLD